MAVKLHSTACALIPTRLRQKANARVQLQQMFLSSGDYWYLFSVTSQWGDGGGGHWLVQMEWRPAGWSVCLPLLIFPCTIKSRSSLLAVAHPGCTGKRAVKRLCVCVCVTSPWMWNGLKMDNHIKANVWPLNFVLEVPCRCAICAIYLRSRHGDPWPDSITSNLPSVSAAWMSSLMSATRLARIVNSLYVTSFSAGRELAQRTTCTPTTTTC